MVTAAPIVHAQDGPTPSTPATTAPAPTGPPPGPSTTGPPTGPPTTGPTDSAPSTTRPGSSSTTTPAPAVTTPFVPTLPPALAADPRAPFLVDPSPVDGGDIPVAQNSFDPLSVAVRPELVTAARDAVTAATATLDAARAAAERHAAEVSRLSAELASLESGGRDAVEAAAAARKALSDRAVAAYLVGDVDERLALLDTDDVVDIGVARSYVGVVVDANQQLVRRYERLSRALDRDQLRLADDLAEASLESDERTRTVRSAFADLLERVRELSAYEAGAQAYVDGFVFPVAGETEFIDSWGFPRMSGTPSAHWHQGTDVFAAFGTPLIASENGVLERVGVASLGGNKLWVRGDSGVEYYYAHLAAFAPGVAEGRRVRAGEVVGYVGDTGNARGTSPHLHFEIHPGGLGPINPYPLLTAAYGNRPVARASAPASPPPGGGQAAGG